MIEYRIGWNASSSIGFRGFTDWSEWGGFEDTVKDVEEALYSGTVTCDGLGEALEASGFDWWVETREAGPDV